MNYLMRTTAKQNEYSGMNIKYFVIGNEKVIHIQGDEKNNNFIAF